MSGLKQLFSRGVILASAFAALDGIYAGHLSQAKEAPYNKGRSNNKPGARAKDRARTKAAHKARMAQKRRK